VALPPTPLSNGVGVRKRNCTFDVILFSESGVKANRTPGRKRVLTSLFALPIALVVRSPIDFKRETNKRPEPKAAPAL
jgi:hypothetical protein